MHKIAHAITTNDDHNQLNKKQRLASLHSIIVYFLLND